MWGMDYKTLIVISQVLGYSLSKFFGIKYIAELRPERRIPFFLALIGVAQLALMGFAVSPVEMGVLWLFLNGIPLGMVWGIVFSYCEGRKFTEIITVILSANFIISSGFAKSLGRYIVDMGYSEHVMPCIVGGLFLPLLAISMWMLTYIPPPDQWDIENRKERVPMDASDRKRFFGMYSVSIILFVVIYLLLTIIRTIRDNFAVEIWQGLGFSESSSIYTTTELPVTIVILVVVGLLYIIKDNIRALNINILMLASGVILLLLSTWLYTTGVLSPVTWMIVSGIGLFVPYILLNGILYDRYISTLKTQGNVGFITYIADATGYLGSVLIMLYSSFGFTELNWLQFYVYLCFVAGVICLFAIARLYIQVRRDRGVIHNQQ